MNYHIISNTFDSLDTMWFEQRMAFSGQSLFILPEWLQIWWEVFKPTAKLFLISIYQDEAPLGLAPLMVKDNIATFIGEPEIIDYQDCIVVSGREREFFAALLDYLDEQKISQLDLRMLRPESSVLTDLIEMARLRNHVVSIETDGICSEIELPNSWHGYLALLKPKQCKEVKRKIRRLQETGEVHFRVLGVKEVLFLGLPDQELEDTPEFRKKIVRLIRRYRPQVVVTTDPYRRYIWHRDHRICGQVVLDAIFPYARDRLAYPELLVEGLEPHKVKEVFCTGPAKSNYEEDVTNTIDLKINSIRCYVSQIGTKNAYESIEELLKMYGKKLSDDESKPIEYFYRIETPIELTE